MSGQIERLNRTALISRFTKTEQMQALPLASSSKA